MVARAKGGKSPPNSARGKSPPNSGRGGGGGASSRSMNTAKGVFSFTMVTDGCYIEHKVHCGPWLAVQWRLPVLARGCLCFPLLDAPRAGPG